MIFDTRVAGIPCQCQVLAYSPPRPMCITGSGFGDALPPEEEVFEFQLLDTQGKYAPWLERKLTQGDRDRLLIETITGVTP